MKWKLYHKISLHDPVVDDEVAAFPLRLASKARKPGVKSLSVPK